MSNRTSNLLINSAITFTVGLILGGAVGLILFALTYGGEP